MDWLAAMPWAARTSNRRRRGLVSIFWTNAKHFAAPSVGMLLPAITSNQPSLREVWVLEWT